MQLGVDQKTLSGRDVPCPCCGGKDRFRFLDTDGNGTYYCRQCGGSSGRGGGSWGIPFVMAWKKVNFRGACELVEEVIGKSALTRHRTRSGEEQAREAQRWIWDQATPLDGYDPPSIYLKSRSITCLPPGNAVRYIAQMADWDRTLKKKVYHPAMIARMVNHEHGALHITYLTIEGKKAEVPVVKKFFNGARVPEGGAVRLAPAAEKMGVSTGIETSLSASQKHDDMPVWATLSDVGLLKFEPPPICRHIIIFGDRDESYSGQMAAMSLAHILAKRSLLKVRVRLPSGNCKDWNDVVQAERATNNIMEPDRNEYSVVEDAAGEGVSGNEDKAAP